MEGPQFLGIGAQKAATTWLEHCLRKHPAIWLPPRKELHYFDTRGDGWWAERRVFGPRSAIRRLCRELTPRVRADVRFLDMEGLRWDLNYFFGRRTDAWYLSLFPRNSGTVSGEITPAYSILEESEVAHVRTLLPDVKLIFLMRDPIDRSWSQMRMDLAGKGRRVEELSLEDLLSLARSDSIAHRSNYCRTLRNWGRHFPESRFFVRFLEDVRDEPELLLAELFDFLGVQGSRLLDPGLLKRRVHAGKSGPAIPCVLAREFARLHLETIREVESRFGGPAVAWRERAERLMAG